MKADVRVKRTKEGTIVYLVNPADPMIAVWHFEHVSDPLSHVDETEVKWACDQLGLDKRATFVAIRDALKASR